MIWRHGRESLPARRRVLARAGLATVAVLAVAVAVTSFWSLPYYAITPGAGIAVSGMVTVPASLRHHHRGGVLMTDVNVVRLRAIDYLFYRWNGDDEVVPSVDLTGPANAAQYNEQGVIDMANARQAATVVALSTLGYKVSAAPAGVIVYQPLPGTPAAKLPVGDVITAVAGHPTASPAALRRVLAGERPGTTVRLTIHAFGRPTGRSKGVPVRLGESRSYEGGVVCVPSGTRTDLGPPPAHYPAACLGILPEPAYRTVGLPFAVKIDSEGIIGPSAGLAFTLGLLEALDRDDLTGGRVVAATGTMSIGGEVGDVGGVAQKTVAVERAGATVFFVPPQEYSTAKAHASPSLKVEPVSSLHQAVLDLERLGGRLALPGKSATRS